MTEYLYPTCKITAEEFNYRHWIENESLGSIAKSLGIFPSTLRHHLLRNGLTCRTKPQADEVSSEIGDRKTYSANYRLFSTWSAPMAWALGLLASDGNVHGSRVSFGVKDLDLVEQYREVLAFNGPISIRKDTGVYVVRLTSAAMAKDLAALGVVPAKSLILTMPPVPDIYLRDFVRGVFDGDGSVGINRGAGIGRRDKLRATIITCSKDFADGLHDRLDGASINHTVMARPAYGARHPQYVIHMGSKQAIDFYHFLYDDAPASLYLARKHQVFEDFLATFDGSFNSNGRLNHIFETHICSEPGCGKIVAGLGLCHKHYQRVYRLRKNGPKLPKPPLSRCSVDGCIRTVRTSKIDLCEAHYRQRLRKEHRAHANAPADPSHGKANTTSQLPVISVGSEPA